MQQFAAYFLVLLHLDIVLGLVTRPETLVKLEERQIALPTFGSLSCNINSICAPIIFNSTTTPTFCRTGYDLCMSDEACQAKAGVAESTMCKIYAQKVEINSEEEYKYLTFTGTGETKMMCVDESTGSIEICPATLSGYKDRVLRKRAWLAYTRLAITVIEVDYTSAYKSTLTGFSSYSLSFF